MLNKGVNASDKIVSLGFDQFLIYFRSGSYIFRHYAIFQIYQSHHLIAVCKTE